MNSHKDLQQDLDYIASAVRRREQPAGIPVLFAFWGIAILIGFASADFAPRITGWYWLVVGIGGGLFSMWMGDRQAKREGVRDKALGVRYGLHWTMGGIGYFLTALPMLVNGASAESAAPFLLTTGLVYGLAGVHLERPLLWCGLIAFAGYAALVLLKLPYAWTLSGALICACLLLAAVFAAKGRAAGDAQ